MGCPFLTQQAVIFRVSDVMELGGFNSRYPISADSEMISAIISRSAKIKLVNKYVACYDISDIDRLSTNSSLINADRGASSRLSFPSLLVGSLLVLLFRAYNLPLYLQRCFSRLTP
jgi:hypothetical protein